VKVAVIGPICKDKNIVGKNIFEQIGGIPYYTGNALFFLGAMYQYMVRQLLQGMK